VKVSNKIREAVAMKDGHLSIPTRLQSIVTSRKQGHDTCVKLDQQRCSESVPARSDLRDPVSNLHTRCITINIGREQARTQDVAAEWFARRIESPVFRAFTRISLCPELSRSFLLLLAVLHIVRLSLK
jgi:hypothetical protein